MKCNQKFNFSFHSVFALANKKDEIEVEMSSMASLLAKFRIDYSDLELISDITKKAQNSTYQYFQDIISNFTNRDSYDENKNGNYFRVIFIFKWKIHKAHIFIISPLSATTISENELIAVKEKTNRYLRLREHLIQNSLASDLIVMTLPMPRKNVVSAPLYMAWLESLSRGFPPFLFVRGNQTSVLTFYS